MTLLVLSPDFTSHYRPLSVLARAAQAGGRRVVIATGTALRQPVERDGFEWAELRLGATSNGGVADRAAIEHFLAATRAGAVETIRHQARAREQDLLWEPEAVARRVAELCTLVDPAVVLVDHVSFGSTLAMHATGRPFVTLVPGHPSQLPAEDEQYGVPATWPSGFDPDPDEQADLIALADRIGHAFTDRWNAALRSIAPARPTVDDALRVHGNRVLFNSVATLSATARRGLPVDHRFVGPLVRTEFLPERTRQWLASDAGRPLVYVALGTFLSHRDDVLATIVAAVREVGARAAVAVGATAPERLGPIPCDWLVAPHLPQVALLPHVDLAIHHGGNNSVQESLAAGARQLVLPFSTDQFANAADLERAGVAEVLDPNRLAVADLADVIGRLLSTPPPRQVTAPTPDELNDALFAPTALAHRTPSA